MKTGTRIDYKNLRSINPQAARMAVLEYLSTNGGNTSDAARVFGINRTVIYDIIRKEKEGDLRDRSKAPKHCPHKTPTQIEDKVIEVKNKTHMGPKRLSIYLGKHEHIAIPMAPSGTS